MKRVAIVVLNWNSEQDTLNCISSLLNQREIIPDIILVDNNSESRSVRVLEDFLDKHPHAPIHFIPNPINSGYSGGNNVGFLYALKNDYRYIGTLNPDAVADPLWVSSLIACFESQPDLGIATGLMAKADHHSIDTAGEVYSIWGIPGPRLRGAPLNRAPKEGFVFASTGGGFIAKAEMLRKVGLFDERFFMYFEDVDLCFRAQLLGFGVFYTPRAVAYHKISASSKKVPGLTVEQTFKNLPVLFTKNVPLPLWGVILPRFTLAYLLIFGNAIRNNNGRAAFTGWFKSLSLISHALRERYRIQSSRTVTVDYIKDIMLHDIPVEQTGLRAFRKLFTGR